tara:strand:+ start:900 stop:1724 length:825 start_codon:yes stop_codon:yes gene_type:complete
MRRVTLLKMEGSEYMQIDGITTVTFFKGQLPRDAIKKRFFDIIKANPWIAGRLEKCDAGADKGKVQIVFDTKKIPDGQEFDDSYLKDLFFEVEVADFSSSTPFEQINEKIKNDANLKKAHIAESGWTLLKKKLPFTKLTVVRSANANDTWALIFSVSHTIADGYTYYRLLNMLSLSKDSNESVRPLKPERKHDFPSKVEDAVGKQEWATVMGGGGLICNYISNMVFGKKPITRAFYVDLDEIKKLKGDLLGNDSGEIDLSAESTFQNFCDISLN